MTDPSLRVPSLWETGMALRTLRNRFLFRFISVNLYWVLHGFYALPLKISQRVHLRTKGTSTVNEILTCCYFLLSCFLFPFNE